MRSRCGQEVSNLQRLLRSSGGRPEPRRQSKPARRTLPPVRTIFKQLGILLAGLAIGYVLARSLNRLTWWNERNEIAVDFPPGSEAEREWRLRVSGLEGTARTAL